MSSNNKYWFFIASVIIVLISATLASGHFLGIGGIRPNITLAVLIALCFFIDNLFFYSFLVIFGCIGIRFAPGISIEAVAFALVAMAAFFIKERFVWRSVFGVGILIFLGTFGIYALVQPTFIYQHFWIVIFEAVYNIVLGLAFFQLISLYVKKTRLTI